jgi:hypothetical protein
VDLPVALLIVAAATAVAVAAMLLVRRRAPDGGYFNDGDRAAGVFGVLATGFAVLLGFVVFLAFTSYDAARAGAETEALIVSQQVETAQLFPADIGDELTGDLVCYARSVAGVQWERMEDGTLGEDLNPWSVEMFERFRRVDPQMPAEQAAYGKWLDERTDREPRGTIASTAPSGSSLPRSGSCSSSSPASSGCTCCSSPIPQSGPSCRPC